VKEAYEVWLKTRDAPDSWPDERRQEADVYFHQANMEEQPDLYENLDFKRSVRT
jgi:hypothetical protein